MKSHFKVIVLHTYKTLKKIQSSKKSITIYHVNVQYIMLIIITALKTISTFITNIEITIYNLNHIGN